MEANYPILEWRIGLRQSGWKEVLRAPAAHGVSSIYIYIETLEWTEACHNVRVTWANGHKHTESLMCLYRLMSLLDE